MQKLIIALGVAVVLAGCDKSPLSAGVTLETTQQQTNDQSVAAGGDLKVDTSKKDAITIKVPGTLLLGQAVQQYCQENGLDKNPRARFLKKWDSKLADKVPANVQPRVASAVILAIAGSFEPALGWPGDDVGQGWMQGAAAMAELADMVSTEIIGKLNQNSMKDPDAAKLALLQAIAQVPDATLESIWSNIVKKNKQMRASENLAGSNEPVEFQLGSQVITIGNSGMSLKVAGNTVWGEGKIGGKTIDLSLETSLATGTGLKIALDNKQSDSDSSSTKTDASIKN